eukprot:Em0001g3744a
MERKEKDFESTNEDSYSCMNLSAVTDNECSKDDAVDGHKNDTTLHLVDCIVHDNERGNSFVAFSSLVAELHALHWCFPHLKQVILQSDNAKNFPIAKTLRCLCIKLFPQEEWSCLHTPIMKQQQERMYVTPTLPTNKQGWMSTFQKAMVEGRCRQLNS